MKNIIKAGTYLYGDTKTCNLRIVKSHMYYGTGDYEDIPEIRNDKEIDCYYIGYESIMEPNKWSYSFGGYTVSDAMKNAEKVTPSINWINDDELLSMKMKTDCNQIIPKNIDGATVILYASNLEERPLGYVSCDDNGEDLDIAYIVIARYEDSGKLYLFSCNGEYEVLNDIDIDSIEDGKNIVANSFLAEIVWKKL